LNVGKTFQKLRYERLKGFEPVAVCDQHDNRDRQHLEILLKLDVAIRGKKGIEIRGGLAQQDAVRETCPPDLGNRANIVTGE